MISAIFSSIHCCARSFTSRAVSPFGELTGEQWRHLAVHAAKHEDGKWRLRYDPGIGHNFHAVPPAVVAGQRSGEEVERLFADGRVKAFRV